MKIKKYQTLNLNIYKNNYKIEEYILKMTILNIKLIPPEIITIMTSKDKNWNHKQDLLIIT